MQRQTPQTLRALLGAAGLALASPTLAQQALPPERPVLEEAGGALEAQEQPRWADETPQGDGDQVVDDDLVEISQFSEPLQLSLLVEFVADTLGVDITIQGELTGTVSFVAPRTIHKRDLLPLLERLLDQNNFALMYDSVLDRYMVRPSATVSGGAAAGEFSTTRIIPTPNIRPSRLTENITAYSSAVGGIGQISYIDDLGVVVVTGPPLRARQLEDYIKSLVAHAQNLTFTRIELQYISAATARQRALDLTTATVSGVSSPVQGRQENQVSIGGNTTSLDNLSDRLSVESHSNALIFRGLPEEAERVRQLVQLIDKPTELRPQEFFAGTLASQVARIASGLGLGEVIEIDQNEDPNNINALLRQQRNQQGQAFGQTSSNVSGGTYMIVDPQRGRIIHYGTPEQHAQMDELVAELKTDGERIVIEEYKLENAIAEDVAELLQALVDGGNAANEAPLLPGVSRPNQPSRAQPDGFGGEGAFTAQADEVFVGFYQAQNMVLVKAPIDVQSQFKDIIDRLDIRAPQVYMEVQIVSVTNTDNFRFAVESQLIAGQYGLQTNFGLSSAAVDGDFLDRRVPETGLPGLTTALIRSESLPFVINAIQTKTDAKVISSPQLLVNDNAEATITSEEQQPTTSTSQGDGSTVTSFQGFESAGTLLRVRPVISSGGYVRLEYEIELSNFIGTGGNGIPAPKNVRNVEAEAVTVPGDATIVVGGINVQDIREERTGIPLLMDIPLLGALFADTTEISSESLLYIFITPRIMRDDNFRDLRLLTEGPQARVDLTDEMPSLAPVYMDSLPAHQSRGSTTTRSEVTSGSSTDGSRETPPVPPRTEQPQPARQSPPPEQAWPEQRPTLMTPVEREN